MGQQDDSGCEEEEETKDHRSEWVSDAESYTSSASDDYRESMPGQSARRLEDYWWHECTDEASTEDENSLQGLSEPNDFTNTKYRVLDDFFDKFGGGSTKTEDKDAALMADEKMKKPSIVRSGWEIPAFPRMSARTINT